MSQARANQLLRDHGLSFVKVRDSELGPSDGKCYTNFDGKRVKGIYCASKGPMTVTNAADEKMAQILSKVKRELSAYFASDLDSDGYVIAESTRTKTILKLHVQDFPANSHRMNLDPAYRNYYIVPEFEKVKK